MKTARSTVTLTQLMTVDLISTFSQTQSSSVSPSVATSQSKNLSHIHETVTIVSSSPAD